MGDASINILWDVLRWSIVALGEGAFPHLDHARKPWQRGSWRGSLAGKPICEEEYIGILVRFTGSWKLCRVTFGLKYHYGTDQCCHKCHVDKSATATSYTILTWDSAGFIDRRSDEDFKSGAKASLTIPGVHVSALLSLANAVCLHACICVRMRLCVRCFSGQTAVCVFTGCRP